MKQFFENKRLIIYGTGNVGNAFYSHYANELKIDFCTSSNPSEDTIGNLIRITLQELDYCNDYLIICSGYYETIRSHLIEYGWKPIENFMNSILFEQLVSSIDKKLVVCIGQCEVEEISKVLRCVPGFYEKFAIACYSDLNLYEQELSYDLGCALECRCIMSVADFFIQPVIMRPGLSNLYSNYRKFLKENAETIVISLFHFESYWPQDKAETRETSKMYMVGANEKVGAYCECDQIMEELIRAGMTPEDAVLLVMDDNFFDTKDIIERHSNNIKRIRLMDRLADVKILDYVEKNYKRIKLFCDRGHFSKEVLKEYTRRLLEIFKVEYNEECLDNFDYNLIFNNVNEFPIYPSAAKILGLEFIDESTKYHMQTFQGWVDVSFREYMLKLAEYYSYVFAIRRNC